MVPVHLSVPYKCKTLLSFPMVNNIQEHSSVEYHEWGKYKYVQRLCCSHENKSRYRYTLKNIGASKRTLEYYYHATPGEPCKGSPGVAW